MPPPAPVPEPRRSGERGGEASAASFTHVEEYTAALRPPRRAGAVHGRVRRGDGTGVPGVALTLVDTAGRQRARGESGPDGLFTLDAAAPGPHLLIAAAAGRRPQAAGVTVGARPVELDVALGGGGRLTGTVRSAGRAVPRAVVTLTGRLGDVVASARCDDGGRYLLEELPAGAHTLTAGAAGYRPAAVPVSVEPGNEGRQDLELPCGAVLEGTVRATGGRPVEEARVTLVDRGGHVLGSVLSDAGGGFRFAGLEPGDHTVVVAGYPPVAAALGVGPGELAERDLRLRHES